MKISQLNNPEIHNGGNINEAPLSMKKPDCAKAISFGAVRDELIRQTAFSYYEARSCVAGNDLQDWLQAESAVNQMPGKIDQSVHY